MASEDASKAKKKRAKSAARRAKERRSAAAKKAAATSKKNGTHKRPGNGRKAGYRKKKIDDELLRQVSTMGGLGLTLEQTAAVVGVDATTLQRYREENPELEEAWITGKAKGVGLVAGKLRERIMAGDNTAMIFYLKAQGGWRDRIEHRHEVSGPDGGPIQLQDLSGMTDEELEGLANAGA